LSTARQSYDFGTLVTALKLIPVPVAGSWKFLLLAERSPVPWADRYVLIYLDFTNTRKDKCMEDDFETWYPNSPGSDICFMGSKVSHYKLMNPVLTISAAAIQTP
jgi:hypothetical protein